MKVLIISIIALFSKNVYSIQSIDCDVIQWNQNKAYTVYVNRRIGVTMHFDHDVYGARVMNDDIWTGSHEGNHVLVRPKNIATPSIGLWVVDENNKSYNFKLIQTKKTDLAPCIYIKDNQSVFNMSRLNHINDKSMTKISVKGRLNNENKRLKNELLQIKTSRQGQIDRAVNAHMSKVRAKNYDWDNEKVTEVHDDGRFTFVRLNENELTVDSIIGYRYMSDGFFGMWKDQQQEILDVDFISPTNTYKVSGIYDGIILKYGDSEITIKRVE